MPYRTGSSSRSSKYSNSKSSDQKEPSKTVRNTALLRAMSTINEALDRGIIRGDCRRMRLNYKECVEDNGQCSYCDFFLEELFSKCPDFDFNKDAPK